MKGRNRLIMGSAIGLAALAVAIDHTKHRLPEPVSQGVANQLAGSDESPCGLDASPCGLDASPCSLDVSPCSL